MKTDADTVLQKWEGVVDEVRDRTFVARLIPIIGQPGDLEAEIYFDEVSIDDRPLVKPGAFFYWSVGYKDGPAGQRSRESLVRFRRLPRWTLVEINAAQERANKYRNLFDAD